MRTRFSESTFSCADLLIGNGRLTVRRYGQRIGQLNKKLPNPIRRYTTPAIPPTTHFHIPDRISHCRNREMVASYKSGAAPDASVDSSNIQRSSCSDRRRNAGGCKQTSLRKKVRVIMPYPDAIWSC